MGRGQVIGFFMRGELFGLEGIGAGRYVGTAIRLEDSKVAAMPFALMEDMARRNPGMQRRLHAILSQEIARNKDAMMLLGSMSAEARLAIFLINLSTRFLLRGYSPSDLVLRMSRAEMGRYLGLKLETVSRLFSNFQKSRRLEAQHKHIRVLDTKALQRVLA